MPGRGFLGAGDEADERGLSGAVEPEDGDRTPAGEVEIHAFQHRAVAAAHGIALGHLKQAHVVLRRGRLRHDYRCPLYDTIILHTFFMPSLCVRTGTDRKDRPRPRQGTGGGPTGEGRMQQGTKGQGAGRIIPAPFGRKRGGAPG